jgi:SWI/SNF-related matrix-associated actin-dependent regulator of chromatin subfamily D
MKRMLRIQIYCEKQSVNTPQSTAPVTETNTKPYIEENWTINIQGTLLNETGTGEDLHNSDQFKFTHFLKSMIVELDEELFPVKSERMIEWHRTHGFEDCEGFNFTRKVRVENNATALNQIYPVKIMLGIRDDPPLYHVSPLLNEVIGATPLTPPPESPAPAFKGSKSTHDKTKKINYPPHTLNNILTGVWNYIKQNKLQDENDKNAFVCDDKLRDIFGCESMTFANVLQVIKQQLLLPEPRQIQYEVCRTQMGNTFERSFDIEVNISKPQQTEVEALLSEKPLPDVLKYDLQIQKALEGIEQHKKKRDFMLGFSEDPVNFIHSLISSQTRDLLLMSNNQELEQARYSNFYKTPWMMEAAHRYSMKK